MLFCVGCHIYYFLHSRGNFHRNSSNRNLDEDDERSSTVICCQAGDLLIFDNVHTEHSVDVLVPKQGSGANGDTLIRQIIGSCHYSHFLLRSFLLVLITVTAGWRSLEYDCVYYHAQHTQAYKDVSYARGVALQQQFLTKTWPSKLKELELIGANVPL